MYNEFQFILVKFSELLQALLAIHLARTGREIRLAWIFLSLMVGCFLPSARLKDLFEEFLNEKKTDINSDAIFCLKKLTRSNQAMLQPRTEGGVEIAKTLLKIFERKKMYECVFTS